jgi:hypothetical protein
VCNFAFNIESADIRVRRRLVGHKNDSREKYMSFIIDTLPDIVGAAKSNSLRWTAHITRIKGMINAYEAFVGKSQGKRPLGRPRHKWDKRTLRGNLV